VIHGYGPLLTILCALAVGYAIVHRDRIYATIRGDEVWRAAIIGGLAASIAGSLFNDSGPTLLFIGVVALTFVTAYLRSPPSDAPSWPPPESRARSIEGSDQAAGPVPGASDADRAGGGEDARPAAVGRTGAHPEPTGPARSPAGAQPQ